MRSRSDAAAGLAEPAAGRAPVGSRRAPHRWSAAQRRSQASAKSRRTVAWAQHSAVTWPASQLGYNVAWRAEPATAQEDVRAMFAVARSSCTSIASRGRRDPAGCAHSAVVLQIGSTCRCPFRTSRSTIRCSHTLVQRTPFTCVVPGRHLRARATTERHGLARRAAAEIAAEVERELSATTTTAPAGKPDRACPRVVRRGRGAPLSTAKRSRTPEMPRRPRPPLQASGLRRARDESRARTRKSPRRVASSAGAAARAAPRRRRSQRRTRVSCPVPSLIK